VEGARGPLDSGEPTNKKQAGFVAKWSALGPPGLVFGLGNRGGGGPPGTASQIAAVRDPRRLGAGGVGVEWEKKRLGSVFPPKHSEPTRGWGGGGNGMPTPG